MGAKIDGLDVVLASTIDIWASLKGDERTLNSIPGVPSEQPL